MSKIRSLETRRLVSFRLSSEERAQLEELAFLIANADQELGLVSVGPSKTRAVTCAVATLLGQFRRAAADRRVAGQTYIQKTAR